MSISLPNGTILSTPSSSSAQLSAAVTRILLLERFSSDLKTRDLQAIFKDWQNEKGGFVIKWIDDVSALVVFADAGIAKKAYLTYLLTPPPLDPPPKIKPYDRPDAAQIIQSLAARTMGHGGRGSFVSSSVSGSVPGLGGGGGDPFGGFSLGGLPSDRHSRTLSHSSTAGSSFPTQSGNQHQKSGSISSSRPVVRNSISNPTGGGGGISSSFGNAGMGMIGSTGGLGNGNGNGNGITVGGIGSSGHNRGSSWSRSSFSGTGPALSGSSFKMPTHIESPLPRHPPSSNPFNSSNFGRQQNPNQYQTERKTSETSSSGSRPHSRLARRLTGEVEEEDEGEGEGEVEVVVDPGVVGLGGSGGLAMGRFGSGKAGHAGVSGIGGGYGVRAQGSRGSFSGKNNVGGGGGGRRESMSADKALNAVQKALRGVEV